MRCLWLALLLFSNLAGAIAVVDDAGRPVEVTAPAQRIIALAPHIVENLYAAGAGERIVGAVDYSDYPDAAGAIPRVGSFSAFSLEAVIAAKPDLVVIWGSGNGMGTLAKLAPLQVPIYVSEPRALADIPRTLRALGALAGTAETAETAARRFEAGIAELGSSHRRAQPLRVLFQIWNQPLQTVSGDHLISEVLALCGGVNLFADARTLAPKLNIESVLQRNPEVIIGSGAGSGRPAWLDDWRAYPTLAAVENDALFYVDPDHILRPTPRLLLGARSLCEQLSGVR
jgi:iron complex transport system substrate-binding protein